MRNSVVKMSRIPLNSSSWFVFIISFIIYFFTMDSGVSYWDSPEYVTTASLMEIGHPPGNPVWTLLMRVATIPFPSAAHAYVVNICDGIMMAFASFFLCRLIYIPVFLSLRNKFAASLIAVGASLCFAFCDSTWFSAVEAEVYAMSAMFMSMMLWLMELWWFEKDPAASSRLLILVAYLTGLSLGVHELNLLCIPVFVLIILYKRYQDKKVGILRALFWILVSFIIVVLILKGVMQGVPHLASGMELLSVNRFGFPYNSGIYLFIGISVIVFIMFFPFTKNFEGKTRRWMETGLWCAGFILLGYSSFGIIIIRSMASPPMNEATPDNIFALSSYINRELYPSYPIIYGHTPYSVPVFEEVISHVGATYNRYVLEKGSQKFNKRYENPRMINRSGMVSKTDSDENLRIIEKNFDGYLLSDYNYRQKLTPELDMWFPRITSRNISDRSSYADWAGMTEETMDRVPISEAMDSSGNFVSKMNSAGERIQNYSYRPSYAQNLKFFITYQAFYMYLRYLLWNFVGKQNDYHSMGEIDHGNFITGISVIDDFMLGPQEKMPAEIGIKNPGRNVYFGIPFLIGIIGILWLATGGRKRRRILWVILLFFLMTGLAIVVYLNQTPAEPRERDYSYLGSYMAFSMWIAAGFCGILKLILKTGVKKWGVPVICLFSLFPCILMACVNFDDHNRRGRFETSFFASGILDYEKPSIIFSQGDNTTFPLWYSQEIEGKGPLHTVVDVSYLNLAGYVENLMKQGQKGLKTLASPGDIIYGAYGLIKIPDGKDSDPVFLERALSELYSQKTGIPVFPVSQVLIPFGMDTVTISLKELTGGSRYLPFRQLMLLEILNIAIKDGIKETVYFPTSVSSSFYKAIGPMLRPSLFGKVFSPNETDSIMMERMKKEVVRELGKLKGKDFKNHYIDPVVAEQIVRYRGGLVMAANEFLKNGMSDDAASVALAVSEKIPYDLILPGSFTVDSSTYYEGEDYLDLLISLYEVSGNDRYKKMAEAHLSLLDDRFSEWKEYFLSLSVSQRKALSNQALRILSSPSRLETPRLRLAKIKGDYL